MTARPNPAVFFAPGGERTEGEVREDYFVPLDAAIGEMPGGAPTSMLTIAAGVITPVAASHTVETESGAGTDDLTNIDTSVVEDGAWLLLRADDTAHTVVVKHAATGAGQIHLATGVDFSLDDAVKTLMLERVGADWYEVMRGLVVGADVQPYDADLAAIAALSSTGMIARTGSGTAAVRTITAGTGIGLTNGDGVSGNPTVAITDAELLAIAGLTSAADRLPYFTGSGTAALATFTTAGRNLLDDADTTAQRVTLGLVIGTDVQAYDADLAAIAALSSTGMVARTGSGTAAVRTVTAGTGIGVTNGDGVSGNPTIAITDAELLAIAGLTSAADRLPYFTGSGTASLATFTTAGRNLLDDADTTAQRVTLGLVIGTDVQAYDALLAAIASLSMVADRYIYGTGTDAVALGTITSLARTLLAGASTAAMQATLGVREVLTANRTYYVRTDGSDSNTGLVNNSGSAFATAQKAWDRIVGTLDMGGFDVTIQVGDGTYNGALAFVGAQVGKGTVKLVGNVGTPANVVLAATSANALNVENAYLEVSGCTFQTTTSGVGLAVARLGFVKITGAVRFGACASAQIQIVGARCEIAANYTIAGAAPYHIASYDHGQFSASGLTVAISGSPAFSAAFVNAQLGSMLTYLSSTFGTATGKRYNVDTNAIINTGGGGASYFAGNSSGTTATAQAYL